MPETEAQNDIALTGKGDSACPPAVEFNQSIVSFTSGRRKTNKVSTTAYDPRASLIVPSKEARHGTANEPGDGVGSGWTDAV